LTEVLQILAPGPFTTVQDRGRYGFQQFGVPVSGALDKFAFAAANALVGNAENAAVLEMTFMGSKIEVLFDAIIAVTGADVPVFVNNEIRPTWTSFIVRAGDRIAIGAARKGVRAYLAVSGGIDTPEIMGSRSTYVLGRFGGFEGRPLAKWDILKRGAATCAGADRRPCRCDSYYPFDRVSVSAVVPENLRPKLESRINLRAVPGPQDDYFHSIEMFFGSEFTISSQADRMGYRLEGPAIEFKHGMPKSIISEPSLAGAVQVPADGKPIILFAEQTVGGYAKIATVITSDLDVLAQARPGDRVTFVRVDVDEAHEIYRKYRAKFNPLQNIERG
jgi:antagonist of KipI